MSRYKYEQGETDYSLRQRFDFILDNIQPGSNILDLACSEGHLHKILKRFHKNVTGIDIWENYDSGFQYYEPEIKHNLNNYPWPIESETYDLIVAGEIIEHIHNPVEFLKECNRILKKEGKIIITTPNASSIGMTFEDTTKQDYSEKNQHLFFFNETSMTRILKYTSFELKQCAYTHYARYIPWILFNKKFGQNLMVVARKIQ